MLALRPVVEVLPAQALDGHAAPGTIARRPASAPPAWAKLETREDVLGALRDVGRATLARQLDPRSANAVGLVLQTLLAEQRYREETERRAADVERRRADAAERERKADRRARREWARTQLRDRLEELVEEARLVEERLPEGSAARAEAARFEGFAEYVARLARRARI
ncbi:conserved hypothetical protein [Anaeromyxobacter dehalogenans 2CP-1]|uniref:Uncharacterized protein n=1 Tax=Anaeromyxobacter dehalogenans (strain ATCC BAA-258 / DSM 21875 / 2CP-1) TaxID=455488 RepID=B8J966_ANAD2|nr:hypothetical protein [Anaeromyxobacter dehalogenans]ACL65472.1 conserved hypothetical protein [Anaeromyxobacter dehalogenans 2CP-1]